jgi:WD40 repeat protein
VATGEIVGQPLRHHDDILSVHFSGDGTMIVTASDDQTARVWDAETGQPESEPLRHAGPVRDAEFNAAGDRVVTASDDGTAHVWDVLRGSPDDANALAALAEAVGGSMVTVRGAAGHATDQLASLARLRHETASASGPGISGFIRWFLADRAVRPSSPRDAITTHNDQPSSVTPVSK